MWKSNLSTDPPRLRNDIQLIGEVPEPTTWAMMPLGFAGLGFGKYYSRRRRKTGRPTV